MLHLINMFFPILNVQIYFYNILLQNALTLVASFEVQSLASSCSRSMLCLLSLLSFSHTFSTHQGSSYIHQSLTPCHGYSSVNSIDCSCELENAFSRVENSKLTNNTLLVLHQAYSLSENINCPFLRYRGAWIFWSNIQVQMRCS